MISEGLFDSEDWSKAWSWKLCFPGKKLIIFKYIKIETIFFYCNNIKQYYWF